MAHKFPCPQCNFQGAEDGDQKGKVWAVYKSLGYGECLDCGFMLDEKIIRENLNKVTDMLACSHRFAETGMKRSWCADCGTVGEYDFYEGKYKEIFP